MNIKKIKSALYFALKNDFSLDFYDADKNKVIFSFYPLNEVNNGLIKIYYNDRGELSADSATIDFQYCQKTKKAENLLKKFSESMNGITREQFETLFPVFSYYSTMAKKVYYAKFSICVNLYTTSEDIKNYREA